MKKERKKDHQDMKDGMTGEGTDEEREHLSEARYYVYSFGVLVPLPL